MPCSGEHRGEGVAERDPRAWRRLARKAVDVAEPAHRLRDGREARTLGVRTGLAVAGDAGQDDALVRGREPVVPEIPPLERARPEVLGEDVGNADELEQELLPSRLAEIQRDALLVPRLHRPEKGSALVARLAPFAQWVGLPGRLDLDDLRTHVAQQAPGERPRQQRPELDQAHACEGAWPGVVACHRITGANPLTYHAVQPPSTSRTWPVTSAAWSDAR